MDLQCVFWRHYFWMWGKRLPKFRIRMNVPLTIKTPKQCQWRRLTLLWCVNFKKYLLSCQIFILCCKDIFCYVLVFNVSRFSRLCSQARFITKQKEIDVKSVYLNLGSDKVPALPVFHTFAGTDIKGSFLIQGKNNCW